MTNSTPQGVEFCFIPFVVQYYDLKSLLPAAGTLLSTLAYYGQLEEAPAACAFQSGAARLNSSLRILPKESCELAASYPDH